MLGPVYSGIGFTPQTWQQYGGLRFAPMAGDATPQEQVFVARKIEGSYVPDQHGCDPRGW